LHPITYCISICGAAEATTWRLLLDDRIVLTERGLISYINPWIFGGKEFESRRKNHPARNFWRIWPRKRPFLGSKIAVKMPTAPATPATAPPPYKLPQATQQAILSCTNVRRHSKTKLLKRVRLYCMGAGRISIKYIPTGRANAAASQ